MTSLQLYNNKAYIIMLFLMEERKRQKQKKHDLFTVQKEILKNSIREFK